MPGFERGMIPRRIASRGTWCPVPEGAQRPSRPGAGTSLRIHGIGGRLVSTPVRGSMTANALEAG